VSPAARRAALTHARETAAISQRRACRYLGVHRSLVRYRSRRAPDTELRKRLRELAERHPRWGSPRLTWLLWREGWNVNHKRVERVYRSEGLAVRRRRRKRVARPRVKLEAPDRANERWSMDFMRDTLADGRVFRLLTVVDDHTRESPVIEVDVSLPGERVVRVLERLRLTRGLPGGHRRRQRAGVHGPGARCLGAPSGREATVHPAGQAGRKRVHRELQRPAQG
jgi:putative transposase